MAIDSHKHSWMEGKDKGLERLHTMAAAWLNDHEMPTTLSEAFASQSGRKVHTVHRDREPGMT